MPFFKDFSQVFVSCQSSLYFTGWVNCAKVEHKKNRRKHINDDEEIKLLSWTPSHHQSNSSASSRKPVPSSNMPHLKLPFLSLLITLHTSHPLPPSVFLSVLYYYSFNLSPLPVHSPCCITTLCTVPTSWVSCGGRVIFRSWMGGRSSRVSSPGVSILFFFLCSGSLGVKEKHVRKGKCW